MTDRTFPTFRPRLQVAKGGKAGMTHQNSVRAWRNSPEDVYVQIRLEGRYVSASLTLEQARALGKHLQAIAEE